MTKKLYWIVIAFLLLSGAGLYVATKAYQKSQIEEALSQFAIGMSNGAPKKIDEYTTLERAYARELNIFVEYSVVQNAEFNKEQNSKLLALFNEVVCQTPRFKNVLLKNGVTFHFSYKLGSLETRVFVFSLEDCY